MSVYPLLLPLAGLAASVGAQSPGQFPAEHGTLTQAALSQEMATCSLRHDRVAAVALAAADNEVAERAALDRLHGDMVACLATRRSATLSGLFMKSAIAERLLVENDAALLTRMAALAPVPAVRVSAGPTAGHAALACAVRADPSDAAALLRAQPATPDEAAAFRKLAPALQDCVPATGAVSIKAYEIRATLAIEAYQAVHRSMTVGRADTGHGTHNA